MRRTTWLVALWVLVSLPPALAGAAERGRFYAGVGVGSSSVDGLSQAPSTITVSPTDIPTSVSINGLPFDDDHTAWSAFIGYSVTRYIGIEAGYWDHGRFENKQVLGPVPASLDITEFYLGATLQYPLFSRLALTGSVGASRARFDVEGVATVLTVPPPSLPLPPFPFPVRPPVDGQPVPGTRELPLDAPDDETGAYWQVGLSWRATDRVGVGLTFGRHDVQVQKIRAIALSVSLGF